MAYKQISPIAVANGGTGAATFTADGVLYGNGTSAIGVTAVGTASQVLTSNGAGMAPTYQTGPTGANLFLIQSQTASSSASLAFTSGISGTYNTYFLIWSAVIPATSTDVLQMQLSTNGGSSYVSSGYTSGINYAAYNTASLTNANSTSTILLSSALATTALQGASGYVYLYNLTDAAASCISGQTNFTGSTTGAGSYGYTVCGTGPASVNAFKVYMSTGNIASGTFTLFGILE